MNGRHVFSIMLRQYYVIRNNPSRVMHLFIWVLVDMLVWGFMTRYLNSIGTHGIDFIPALLGAVLFWDIFIRIMQGVTMAYMEDSWSRNIFNVFASPLTVGEYLAGLVASSLFTSMVGIAVMFLLASGIFGLSAASYGLVVVPFMMVIFLFGIALGIIGCALMLRLGPSAEWFIWPIPAVLSPFAGVFYPLSTLPEWMQGVAVILPPSHVFESMRAVVNGADPSYSSLAAGLGLCVVYIVLACLIFIHVHRRALRTGAVARFSAEGF